MRLESIDTRAWRRLSKIAHSETTVATANGQGIELAECLQIERKCWHGALPAAIGANAENVCSSRAFLRLTLSGHG
jgi:hypothetical protein